jgi:hypothetical protein
VDNEHAMKNRLNAEQIARVLPIVVDQYPFYAPMIFAPFTLGLRYCHVAAMPSSKLGADGVGTGNRTRNGQQRPRVGRRLA